MSTRIEPRPPDRVPLADRPSKTSRRERRAPPERGDDAKQEKERDRSRDDSKRDDEASPNEVDVYV